MVVNLNLLVINTQNINNVVLSHQIYLFSIWSLLVELPRLVMRYGKVTINNYLNLHSITMGIFSMVTIYYIVVMLLIFSDSASANQRASSIYLMGHYNCALIMLGVLTMQMITGISIRGMMFAKKYPYCMPTMKFIHKISGYLIIMLGRVTICLGLLQNGNDLL
jgi:hypothetical protein